MIYNIIIEKIRNKSKRFYQKLLKKPRMVLDNHSEMRYNNLRIIRKFAKGGKDVSGYATEQRKLLMLFLQCHPDECFSAAEIAEALSDASISLSAVYRNLSYLEKEGLINRQVKAGRRESYYQFVAAASCRNCLHLSCVKCGSVHHMQAESIEGLLQNGFALDCKKTVLYGVCRNCTEKENEI